MQLDHGVVTSKVHTISFEIALTLAVPYEVIHASSIKALKLGDSMLASFVSFQVSLESHNLRAFVLEA